MLLLRVILLRGSVSLARSHPGDSSFISTSEWRQEPLCVCTLQNLGALRIASRSEAVSVCHRGFLKPSVRQHLSLRGTASIMTGSVLATKPLS